MKLRVSYCIEHGINKQICDDTALIGTQVINDQTGIVELETPAWICLCDGVGGNAGGQDASVFVAHEFSLKEKPNCVDDVRKIFHSVNESLLTRAANTIDHKQMATTATALYFSETASYLGHVGNTRLYSKRGQFIQQITNDQTTYQWLLDHGNTEAAELCDRSEIRGAIGGGRSEFLSPLITEQVFERKIPNVMILTTDGVHDYLSQDEIEEIITEAENCSDIPSIICHRAIDKGSNDDRSVIIVEKIASE